MNEIDSVKESLTKINAEIQSLLADSTSLNSEDRSVLENVSARLEAVVSNIIEP
jgi:hypothetical protein